MDPDPYSDQELLELLDPDPSTLCPRYKELKKENETLKAELESLETGREELQGRLEDLAAQLLEAEDKVADLQRLADQSRSLKDEVDILRETSDKVIDGFWMTYSGSGSYRTCQSFPDPGSYLSKFSGSRACNLCNGVVDQDPVGSILPNTTCFFYI